MSDKITINLDSTVLGDSGCLLALNRKVINGYTDPLPASNLIYGVAVHKFVDTMYKTKGDYRIAKEAALKAFDIPKIDNRKSAHLSDRNHMITVCFTLWESFVKEEKDFKLLELMLPCWNCKGAMEVAVGVPCPSCNAKGNILSPSTEVTFSIKYYEDEFIIVNLCGTIDRIGKIHNGCYCIRDWKTTSGWDTGNYFKQYELSRQLRMYRLALRLVSQMHPDSVLGKVGSTNVGCFIDAIFLKPAANDVKIISSDMIPIGDKEIDDFQMLLDDKIKEISQAVKTGYWPKQGILNGSCERKYGKCPFWNCCNINDDIANVLLKRDFKQKPFDPLNYNTD